jgi:hypothetical protein
MKHTYKYCIRWLFKRIRNKEPKGCRRNLCMQLHRVLNPKSHAVLISVKSELKPDPLAALSILLLYIESHNKTITCYRNKRL